MVISRKYLSAVAVGASVLAGGCGVENAGIVEHQDSSDVLTPLAIDVNSLRSTPQVRAFEEYLAKQGWTAIQWSAATRMVSSVRGEAVEVSVFNERGDETKIGITREDNRAVLFLKKDISQEDEHPVHPADTCAMKGPAYCEAPWTCSFPSAIVLRWYCVNPGEDNYLGFAIERKWREGTADAWIADWCGVGRICPHNVIASGTYYVCKTPPITCPIW